MDELEFESSFPPNARISLLQFDDATASLVVSLDQAAETRVSAEAVTGLFGARIRRESITTRKTSNANVGRMVASLAITAATGIPVSLKGKDKKGPTETRSEELHYALALRVQGVPEVWYLLANSFNFRKALGPEAGYALEMNVRSFVRRAADFCSGASRDPLFEGIVAGRPLPPPVDSLLEFLRAIP